MYGADMRQAVGGLVRTRPHVCLQQGPASPGAAAWGGMLLLTSFMVKYTPSGTTSSSLFSSDTTQPSSFMASRAPLVFTTFSVIFLLDSLILRNFSSLGATAQLYSSFPMTSNASALLMAWRAASAPAHARASDQRRCVVTVANGLQLLTCELGWWQLQHASNIQEHA